MIAGISVLLADDHTLFREMLRERLQREPGFRVIACVESAERAVAAAETDPPAIALLDIAMPGLSAFEGARLIREGSRSTRVVFLSGLMQDSYIQQALDVGASGYLLKTEEEGAFLGALRRVAAGGTCYSDAVRRRILVGPTGVSLLDQPASRGSLLTDREREVLSHVASGLSKKSIARVLGISDKTVDHHCTNIMTKLDIHDRVELARFAVREGLVAP